MTRGKGSFILVSLFLSLFNLPALAGDYDFDIGKFEKKTFEWGGYAEIKAEHLRLNTDSSAYKLAFLNQPYTQSYNRYTGTLEFEARYRKDPYSFHLRTHSSITDELPDSSNEHKIYEAYHTTTLKKGLQFTIGKKSFRWGKGYAWSPVAFLERPKDPNDPDLSREGFIITSFETVKTGSDDLKTVSFTPILVPVSSDINEDFGETGHVNLAAKLSLLYKDTDIDLMFLSRGSKSGRIGLDFSKNIKSNLEIHGELAYFRDQKKIVLTSGNTLTRKYESSVSYLLGTRYLSENETTWILEYYHNGAGYSEQEMALFHSLVDTASSTTPSLLPLAQQAAVSGYLRPTPMRNYLYIRASNKEPFDILYFTPAVTAIINLDDHSWSLTPEFIYTRYKNVELRTRLTLLEGNANTEFGEKQNDKKFEFRLRYFF